MGEKTQKSMPPTSDFQEKALAIEQHGKEITDHGDRIMELENKLATPAAIAELLEFAAEDSKKLDRLFANLFISMLKDEKANPEVKNLIVEIVQKTDRNAFFVTTKKWARAVGVVLIYLLGLLSPLLIEWLKKKLGL